MEDDDCSSGSSVLAWIASSSIIQGVTYYKIRVEEAESAWTVNRRYNDFRALDAMLKMTKAVAASISLPPKGTFGLRHRFNFFHFNERRQHALDLYIKSLVAQSCPLEGAISEFLGCGHKRHSSSSPDSWMAEDLDIVDKPHDAQQVLMKEENQFPLCWETTACSNEYGSAYYSKDSRQCNLDMRCDLGDLSQNLGHNVLVLVSHWLSTPNRFYSGSELNEYETLYDECPLTTDALSHFRLLLTLSRVMRLDISWEQALWVVYGTRLGKLWFQGDGDFHSVCCWLAHVPLQENCVVCPTWGDNQAVTLHTSLPSVPPDGLLVNIVAKRWRRLAMHGAGGAQNDKRRIVITMSLRCAGRREEVVKIEFTVHSKDVRERDWIVPAAHLSRGPVELEVRCQPWDPSLMVKFRPFFGPSFGF